MMYGLIYCTLNPRIKTVTNHSKNAPQMNINLTLRRFKTVFDVFVSDSCTCISHLLNLEIRLIDGEGKAKVRGWSSVHAGPKSHSDVIIDDP